MIFANLHSTFARPSPLSHVECFGLFSLFKYSIINDMCFVAGAKWQTDNKYAQK